MNILLIHTHDTGRHLGCYGAAVETPNLSRLAGEGVLFRKAFCASPSCSASRTSLMTGQVPHTNGVIGLVHRGFRMNRVEDHLSHRLRRAGYRTQLVGMQHEVPAGQVAELLGYDGVAPNDAFGRHSVERARVAAEWLAAAPEQPFFLNVGFIETHRDFGPVEPPEDERCTAPLPWLPDEPRVRTDVAALQSAVRHVDEAVGIVLDALEKARLAGSTLVIFTTDHGLAFPRAKSTLFDAGIGVALLMRGPGAFAGGRVIDALVSQIDILPTLLEEIGQPVPPEVQGVSLLPLLRGEKDRVRDHIVAELTYHAAYDPVRCIRTDRHKYIRCFADLPQMVLPNVDNGYSKTVLHEAGVPVGPRPSEMLYDLVADPQEFENLIDREEYADVHTDLAARLDAWMAETDDPLRKGDVPLPPGARVTPPDQYDPRLPQ